MMNCSSSSSSSSSSSGTWSYDVFLSFRGEDTRRTFTGHLYVALMDAGINTFIDDNELPRGENISAKLMQAIERSRISIIVFSKSYGDSTWCLGELIHIMECRRTVRQKVYPIFYHVDPSDVRKQSGSFAEAFQKHEEKFPSELDKVRRMRVALTEAANLSGWDLRNTADGHEYKFIKKIVEEVSKQLNNTYLFVALYPVGVDSRVQVMSSLLGIGTDTKVRMVGIWGMGGTGKTTIAKAIYNQFYDSFEGRSFLANVREIWNQPNQRVSLQEQLLSDVLKCKVKFNNLDRGIIVIKERLCRIRILLVVDDVDHVDQLNAVARSRDWFGSGSRIIITTRDKQLLEELEVDFIYMAEKMNDPDALELFSWHAFRRSCPDQDYMQLSSSVVAYCGGLPLALEVLGSFLLGRSRGEWTNALEKLKRIPHEKIQEKLKISYDALSDSTIQDIFLDISCFFIGMNKNYVIQILDGCGLYAEIGITVLLQRSLVTISEKNKLMMHGLLRDMGRDIVREKSPKKLGNRSRLWLEDEVSDVLTKCTGTEKIEGLSLKMESHDKVISFKTEAFVKMQRLRLLQLYHVQLNGSYEYLSKELRWLCWYGFPMKYIPSNFYQGNLVAINLQYSNLRQVWKDHKLLEKLTILNLSHSHHLTRTPNFSKLPNLRKLMLKDCKSLSEVHHSIGHLDRLVLMNLKDCKILKNLPKSFYQIKSLETLILSGCSIFDHLDEDLGEMISLQTLLADKTNIRNVPVTIVRLMNLKYLSLCGLKTSPSKPFAFVVWSWLLRRKSTPTPASLLPPSLQGLSSLTTLCLTGCNLTDDTFPQDFGTSLPSLATLKLQNNNFCRLSSSLSCLSGLKNLWLDNCTMLQSIESLPISLKAFHATNCTALEKMPNLSKMSSIQTLSLKNCHKLLEIPGLDNLKSTIVHMKGCDNISTTSKKHVLQESKVNGRSCVFLPGEEIPEWFDHIKEGNSIYFEVPQSVDCNLEGFVVCVIYSSSSNDTVPLDDHPSMSLINYTKGEKPTRILITSVMVAFHEDNIWQDQFSNDMFNLEAGDKANISLDFGAKFTIKKTGVHLI